MSEIILELPNADFVVFIYTYILYLQQLYRHFKYQKHSMAVMHTFQKV